MPWHRKTFNNWRGKPRSVFGPETQTVRSHTIRTECLTFEEALSVLAARKRVRHQTKGRKTAAAFVEGGPNRAAKVLLGHAKSRNKVTLPKMKFLESVE
jgi:hypothetical protein